MDLKFLNMCSCSLGSVELLADGLVASPFDMVVYEVLSDLLRRLSPRLPVLHVECGTRYSDYLKTLTSAAD